MTLNEEQKKKVAEWINEGLKLSDIQKKLESDLGLRMTYMEVRFLVDDLKLMPKDPEKPKVEKPTAPASQGQPEENPALEPEDEAAQDAMTEEPPAGEVKVAVSVDNVTRPGALVSGNVTFSDGQSAVWYLDQMGRLGLAAKQQGYRPSAGDLQAFQMELQKELQRMGF